MPEISAASDMNRNPTQTSTAGFGPAAVFFLELRGDIIASLNHAVFRLGKDRPNRSVRIDFHHADFPQILHIALGAVGIQHVAFDEAIIAADGNFDEVRLSTCVK